MAATDSSALGLGPVLAAALCLPGYAAAQDDGRYEPASMSLQWLSYRDDQADMARIRVHSPSIGLSVPVGERWRVEGRVWADAVSGASPRYHTAVSGASGMSERRQAGEVRVTRYFETDSVALGGAASDERDYHSRTLSLRAQHAWGPDRTLSWGLAYTADRIGSVNILSLDERRQTTSVELGATQVLGRADLAQVALGHVDARGYLSDPYKSPDLRPRERRQTHLTLRWNHHVEAADATLRWNYRRHWDSFGTRSHTLGLEVATQVRSGLDVTPSVRAYSQDAAWFYYDPVYAYSGVPYPADYFKNLPVPISADQRLAAFGALALGVRVGLDWADRWRVEWSVERYEQRTAWHLRSPGSNGLLPLRALWTQWTLRRQF